DLVTLFMVVGTSATILAIFFTSRLTKIFDKKRLYMICMSIVGLSSLFFYYAKPTDLFLIFSVQIVFSFASGPTMPLLWSMMADTADYSEWKNGRRATGLVFSASTFAQKAGGALGGAIAMYLLAFYGYVANTAQTYETLKGMRLMLSYWPAVAAFICVLILAFYKLDAGLLKKIETELKLRKSNLGLEENIIKLKRR
ncbi:MAG: MFS transporter, partial [candidate division WOR-3 bacterium]